MAQLVEGFGRIRCYLTARIGYLELAQQVELVLATNTFPEMPFHQRQLLAFQCSVHEPGQQFFCSLVYRVSEPQNLSTHSTSSIRLASSALSFRRAWNIRVFTVSIGQPMISAISR